MPRRSADLGGTLARAHSPARSRNALAPGADPLLSEAEAQRIVALVCSPAPSWRARPSVRLIAAESVRRKLVQRVGRETIRLLLQQHDLKPWREKLWCVAALMPDYQERMEDVLAMYEKPYRAAERVVSLDRKPVALHAETRAPLRRTASAFADTVRAIVEHCPFAPTIHLVMDTLNIHRGRCLIARFGEQEGGYLWSRLTVHHTPKHTSWLHMAEIEVGLLSRECLGRRRLADLSTLRHEAHDCTRRARRQKRRIRWTFTRRRARSLSDYQPDEITRSGH